MSDIDNNKIDLPSNELLNLKEEIFSEIRNTEKNLIEQINKKWYKVDSTNKSLLENINLIKDNHSRIIESITLQKLQLEKISDYESFKNKISSMTTTHEVRINSILDDISNFKTKFEKMLLDNLTVPGFIGPSSQYKSLQEYLSYHIFEFSKIKNEKDQLKIELKECKNKIDNFIKNLVSLNDSSISKCIVYIDNKVNTLNEFMKTTLSNFEKKNSEMKQGMIYSQQKLFENVKTHMKNFDNVLELKNDISLAMENKFKEFDIKLNEIGEINLKIDEKEKKIQNLVNNLNALDKKLKEINSNLKETKFKATQNQTAIIKINARLKNGKFMGQSNSTNSNNDIISVKEGNNLSPNKNPKIPNIGISQFKEVIAKGNNYLNKRKTANEDFSLLNKKDSKNNILSSKNKEMNKENSKEQIKEKNKEKIIEKSKEKTKEKSKEKLSPDIKDNPQKNNNKINKIYQNTFLNKNTINNEISFSLITNKNININKINKNVISTNNDFSISSIKNVDILNKPNDNTLQLFFKRNSKSEYNTKKKNKKYINSLKNKTLQINKPIKDSNKFNFKISQININIGDETKKIKTLSNDEGYMAETSKRSKGFNVNTLLQKNIYNNNHKYNIFNYKVVSLDEKVILDNDKDLYFIDLKNPINLKKRTIRLNLSSPLTHTLKTYQNQRIEEKNSSNEMNIKVSPAFGSTAYSFYQRKKLPYINSEKDF